MKVGDCACGGTFVILAPVVGKVAHGGLVRRWDGAYSCNRCGARITEERLFAEEVARAIDEGAPS